MARGRPGWAFGFADEVWFSRLAQPALHAWTTGEPLRLGMHAAGRDDPEPKALACYGLWLPGRERMLLRFVAAYCLFDAMQMIFVSAIRGAGD